MEKEEGFSRAFLLLSEQRREQAVVLCILSLSKCTTAQKMKFNDGSVGSAENHRRLQYFWLI